jgi:hypothetical protein
VIISCVFAFVVLNPFADRRSEKIESLSKTETTSLGNCEVKTFASTLFPTPGGPKKKKKKNEK